MHLVLTCSPQRRLPCGGLTADNSLELHFIPLTYCTSWLSQANVNCAQSTSLTYRWAKPANAACLTQKR